MKTYLLTFGVFQDDDVEPSILSATFVPRQDAPPEVDFEILTRLAADMRVAMKQLARRTNYMRGRLRWEPSDEFWMCDVRELPA